MPQHLAQRHRIWRVADEACLVDIYADAYVCTHNHAPENHVLKQHAADFAVIDVNVVRPLYPDSVAQGGGQGVTDGTERRKGCRLGEVELRVGSDTLGF